MYFHHKQHAIAFISIQTFNLQDVVSHGRKMKRSIQPNQPQGLKTLSKDKRDMLEAYQNLFYLLQTNPTYLAKLIFAMPLSKTTKFMESVILTLYNYAANQREEYLLLKLFKTALEEEIRWGLTSLSLYGHVTMVMWLMGL